MRVRVREGEFREALADGLAQIPALGLIGDRDLIEGFEGDLYDFGVKVHRALKDKLGAKDEDIFWTRALFSNFIVVEREDGKLWKYSYSTDAEENFTFGEGEEVEQAFIPVGDAREAVAGNPFLEATGATGGVWRIRVIAAGPSGNGNYYPDAVLREAAPLFEGVRVFVKSDEEHLTGRGKDVRNLIGSLSEIEFIEGQSTDTGELRATLKLIAPNGEVATMLREAFDRSMTNLFGFSINARARIGLRQMNGVALREAKKFLKVQSVDLIVEPGAAGGIIDIIEAKKEDPVMDRAQLVALLAEHGHEVSMLEALSDDELTAKLREALVSDRPSAAAGADNGQSVREAVDEAVRLVEARSAARDAINASSLPKPAKDRLISRFRDAQDVTDVAVREAISAEADYLSSAGGGQVTGLGSRHRIEPGETRFQKVGQMLEAFFDPTHKDHRYAGSFRQIYVDVTGDQNFTGQIRNCDQALMREALDSQSFPDVLGDSIRRRMLADYNTMTPIDAWRMVVNIGRVSDFRTVERGRIGGYGDLPIVGEGALYGEMQSPTDEKASYGIQKRGGTESVTLEMITNDDVGAIRQIPTKLSRSAKRTLSRFVFGFYSENPVIYDGVAWFHADHGNLGSTALGAASLTAARRAMMDQAELNSGEPLWIPPKYLMVPGELEETAVNLFNRNTENDKTFQQSLSLTVLPVWCWTDATDWVVQADPNDTASIEVGFLNGQEEPEIFIQDNPTVGSMFTNDSTTYKIRHIYGGVPTDYRGVYKAVVAGG